MSFSLKAAFAGAAALSLSSAAFADQIFVEASKSIPVRINGAASSIVIGNKNIADVAVHNENLLFVTGKSYGTTNLLVFDKAGREIYSSDVLVTTNSAWASVSVAAAPSLAEPVFNQLLATCRQKHGQGVETGQFGAHMVISLVNDGPVTFLLRA